MNGLNWITMKIIIYLSLLCMFTGLQAQMESTSSPDYMTGRFIDARDGKSYKTVQIGKQTWMAENLNYVTRSGSWVYNNDSTQASMYGRLYNWETALHVCPAGWHLPDEAEWTLLTDFLGDKYSAGGKLKATGTDYWKIPNTHATNASGFSALPAGEYHFHGIFSNRGNYATFWSSAEDGREGAWSRALCYFTGAVNRASYNKKIAFSVRCIKD